MSKKAKELGLTVFDVPMGLFEFSVRIVIGEHSSADKYAAYVFELSQEQIELDPADSPRGQCYFSPGYIPIVWIPSWPKKAREYATLAHESIHAVGHLYTWARIPMIPENEELLAHSVAHIVNYVLQKGEKL